MRGKTGIIGTGSNTAKKSLKKPLVSQPPKKTRPKKVKAKAKPITEPLISTRNETDDGDGEVEGLTQPPGMALKSDDTQTD